MEATARKRKKKFKLSSLRSAKIFGNHKRHKRHQSSAIQAFFEPWSSWRVESDAKALLARTAPSEESERAQTIDRAVGWLILFWGVPVTMCLPFMARNVWPEKLKLPFQVAGTIFYIGFNHGYMTLRVTILWLSLVVLTVIEILRYAGEGRIIPRLHGNKRMFKMKVMMSKIFFGAFFTFVIYSSGALMSEYKSCMPFKFEKLSEAPCSINPEGNRTNLLLVEHSSFKSSSLVCSVVICFWMYRAALKYVLFERNVEASPTHRFLPAYEALRYTVDAFISGIGSLFRNNPWVTMPSFLVGFSIMLATTYVVQPCQGPGRRANNWRAMGYALGVWFSLYGLIVMIGQFTFQMHAHMIVGYSVLIFGAVFAAFAAWRVNDLRAREKSIPEASFHKLLSVDQPIYVRSVAAEALLLHAEETKGRVDIGARIPQLMRQFLSNSGNGDNRTNRCGTVGTAEIKVASAYILFNSAHRTALRIGSHRHVSRLSNFREERRRQTN